VRFIGTYLQTLDPKGRLALPARFKRLLTPSDQDLLILVRRDECLFLYPGTVWDGIAEELNRLPRNQKTRDAIRSISDFSLPLELDAAGRVTVPREFLVAVGIERDVAVVGGLRHIELWPRQEYEKGREQRRASSGEILDEIL